MINIVALHFVLNIVNLIICSPLESSFIWQYPKLDDQLNISIDPCDDFFEFSCGNWRIPNYLRSLKAADTMTAIQADNKKILLDYFQGKKENEEFEIKEELQALVGNVTVFYKSCIVDNNYKNQNESIKIYTELLRNVNCTLVNSYNSYSDPTHFQWEVISATLRRYGIQTIWKLLVKPNWQDSDQPIIYIVPLNENDRSNGYKKDGSKNLYELRMKYLMMGIGLEAEYAAKVAKQIINFENDLECLMKDKKFVTLQEPHSLEAFNFTKIDFKKYFLHLFHNLIGPEDYVKLEKYSIIVADTDYLERLNNFLGSASTDILSKYFIWRSALTFKSFLNEDELYDRAEYCLQQTNDLMPLELSALFLSLRNSYPDEYLIDSEKKLVHLLNGLKLQFEKLIGLSSENPEMIKSNIERIREIRFFLSHFDQITRKVVMMIETSNDYDLNLIKLSERRIRSELLEVLNKIVNFKPKKDSRLPLKEMSIHGYGPLDINVYYNRVTNAIEIPLGILRSPFYENELNNVQNFGRLIYLIANKLIHNFHFSILNFAKNINVTNNIDTMKNEVSYCLSWQNDIETFLEVMHDKESLRLSLELLKVFPDQLITKQDMKLFFISFAQCFCSDPHSILSVRNSNRVKQALTDFRDFEDVFECGQKNNFSYNKKC